MNFSKLVSWALAMALMASSVLAQLTPGSGTGLSADANTVALYRFEDPATTALDSSGYTRHATVSGTTAGTGLFGSGRIFDGVDDRLELGAMATALVGTTGWTIEYFAKSNDGSNVPYLVTHNPAAGWYLVPGNGSITYGVKTSNSGNDWNVLTSVSAPALDTDWHYYALTWVSGGLSVYRDGTLLGSTGSSGSWSGGNGYGVYLDFDSYSSTYNGAGVVDDLRFSNVARSAGEIQAAYNLAAVPEPATSAILAGLGAVGLALFSRRRKSGARSRDLVP
jgi:hypothetical protein